MSHWPMVQPKGDESGNALLWLRPKVVLEAGPEVQLELALSRNRMFESQSVGNIDTNCTYSFLIHALG